VAAVCAFAPATATAQVPGLPLPPIGPPGEPSHPPDQQPPSAQPVGSPPAGSVTVGVDPAHTGFVDDPNLVPPLQQRWSRKFASVGDVRAAQGKIFAVVYTRSGATLRALDPVTGRDIWSKPTELSPALAYDEGRLFLTHGGTMTAYGAADGNVLWERSIDNTYGFGAEPVAAGGLVYATTGDGDPIAIRQSDGAVVWTAGSAGTENTPAVDASRVYIAYACSTVLAFDRMTGQRQWIHTTNCTGGGGSTPALFGSNVYVPEDSLVLSRATGQDVGEFSGDQTPVFAHDLGLFLRDGKFTAVDTGSGAVRWTHQGQFRSGSGGDLLRISPVAVGQSLYRVASDGVLYSISLEDGKRSWGTRVHRDRDESGELTVAPGLLLSPTGGRLTAYESVFRPSARGISFGPVKGEVTYLRNNVLAGVIGSELRGPDAKVTLELDEHPYKRFRAAGSGDTASDGYFDFRIKTAVNTRIRVRTGNVLSKPVTVYTYPRTHFKFLRRPSRNRVRVRVSFKTARSVKLGGRGAVLYFVRVKKRRIERLDTTRIAGPGRGRGAATFGFQALRRFSKKDYLAVCVKHQVKLGIGRPSPFLSHCGRARIRY
jgi:outer membrane protein assembly factor BamB